MTDGEFVKKPYRRVTRIFPQPNSGSPVIYSDADTMQTAGTLTSVVDTDGVRCEVDTDGTLNYVAGVHGDSLYLRKQNAQVHIRFKILQTSSCRFFAGLTNSGSNTVGSDAPASLHYAGISYSSTRGSHLYFIYDDGSVSPPAAIDTGIALDTSQVYDLYIWLYDTGGSNKMIIQLSNSKRSVITSRLVGNTTILKFEATIKALTAAVKSFELGASYISQDN